MGPAVLAARVAERGEWERQFKAAIGEIHGRCTYQESAEMLRKLVRSGLLRFTDLQEDPERFFAAHRLLLAPNRIAEASGFGVRFTVQFNLFVSVPLLLSHARSASRRLLLVLANLDRSGLVLARQAASWVWAATRR
jgi:hypothetical protein